MPSLAHWLMHHQLNTNANNRFLSSPKNNPPLLQIPLFNTRCNIILLLVVCKKKNQIIFMQDSFLQFCVIRRGIIYYQSIKDNFFLPPYYLFLSNICNSHEFLWIMLVFKNQLNFRWLKRWSCLLLLLYNIFLFYKKIPPPQKKINDF